MKALKCLISINFISSFLFLLGLSYSSEIIDQDILGQVNRLSYASEIIGQGQVVTGEPTTVTLRHVFHHGSTKFPGLFRRIDLTETKARTYELLSGAPLTYTVMGINGTGIKYENDNAVENFRNMSKDKLMSAKLDWRDIFKYLPDIRHWGTLINLAKMTYNAYVHPGDEDWYDIGEHYNINESFGWDKEGVRGYVFATEDNKTLIVSIKGTSLGFGAGPTVPKDKNNDNRFFSCCCAVVDRTWTPVCPCYMGGYKCNKNCLEENVDPGIGKESENLYYDYTENMTNFILQEFPNSRIWLTGHSLGGALSALMGLTFNLPVVAYESPGDRMPADRLHLPRPPATPSDKMNIWHFGHTADPIFMGSCTGVRSFCYLGGYALESKCHVGITYSFDSVTKLNWHVNIRTHSIKEVIDEILSKWWDLFEAFPDRIVDSEEDCRDCELWEYVENL